MPDRRNVLTPDALAMMDTIARTGSFAAAAREMGKVPSALTYSVRQLEDALDVLLFDRSSRQAQLTAAGTELLRRGPAPAAGDGRGGQPRAARGQRLGDASWRSASTTSCRRRRVFELVEAFCGRARAIGEPAAPADAAAPAHRRAGRHLGGAGLGPGRPGDRRRRRATPTRAASSCGRSARCDFVFCVAPHHPLAGAERAAGRRPAGAPPRGGGGRHGAAADADDASTCCPARTC